MLLSLIPGKKINIRLFTLFRILSIHQPAKWRTYVHIRMTDPRLYDCLVLSSSNFHPNRMWSWEKESQHGKRNTSSPGLKMDSNWLDIYEKSQREREKKVTCVCPCLVGLVLSNSLHSYKTSHFYQFNRDMLGNGVPIFFCKKKHHWLLGRVTYIELYLWTKPVHIVPVNGVSHYLEWKCLASQPSNSNLELRSLLLLLLLHFPKNFRENLIQ